MGKKLSKPARVVVKPAKPSTEGELDVAPIVKVLEGAHGVKINGPVTVAGRDVVTNIYQNPPSASAAPTDAHKTLLDKVLESLGKLNFRDIVKENIAKRTPETGRWVIDSDWFKDWLMDLLGGIVWGTGMPGAGKTVLACIVVEHLQKLVEESESKDVCILFAFCRYTERLMVIDILFAILRQLLERHPQVLPFVMPMYERHKREGTRPSEGEIVGLLRQIATSGLFKKTFYILDGLDEAASDIQVDLLRILSSLRVHFFITSRPLDSLKDILPDARFLTIIASDPDIALLIDQKVDRIPALRRLLMDNATLKADVVSIIGSRSSGMFLLASLHLDMLKGCTNERQVRKALEGLPRGMDGMYDATMERIKAMPEHEADLAKRVLIWVTYAQEPLTAEQLVLAVSACPETFQFDDKMEPTGIESILSLCCGLLQLEASTGVLGEPIKLARFVHYSVAEYMVEKLKLHYPDDPHALIASTCIAFLRHCGFHNVLSQNSDDDREILDQLKSLLLQGTSMADYCYQYWGFHATRARLMPPSALEFLDDCKHYPFIQDEENPMQWNPILSFAIVVGHPSVETLESTHVAALYGICEYFDRFKSEGWTSAARHQYHRNLNRRASVESTPLILASMGGREDVVSVLLDVDGVDVNLTDGHGRTALLAAAVNHHVGVVKAILSRGGVDVNRAPPFWPRHAPLTCASEKGQHDIVRLLLDAEGIDVNGADAMGRTALMLATQKGHHDIIRMLVQTMGDAQSDSGRRDAVPAMLEGVKAGLDRERAPKSLMLAARSGRSEASTKDRWVNSALPPSLAPPVIDTLRHGTNTAKLVATKVKLRSTLYINDRDDSGQTALAHATKFGSRESVRILLAVEGVDYSCVDASGQTPLMTAAKEGHDDILALLLELEGMKLDSRDNDGMTALAHAIPCCQVEICKALLKADSTSAGYTTSEGFTYLMLAAECGNAKLIRAMLHLAQFDVNARDIQGRTALALAVESKSYDAVEALLDVEDVNVHCVDEEGTTVLMGAVIAESVELVNRFLNLGLDATINARDIEGKTALAQALVRGSTMIVKTLLGDEGIDYNCADTKGQTPLMIATEQGYDDIVALLLERKGIKLDSTDSKGKTVLARAIQLRLGVDICKKLLKADSAPANYTTPKGLTYLMLAAHSGNAELIRSVLQLAPFDVNTRDIHGRTALAYAVKSESYGAVEALLEVKGANIFCADEEGRTLLIIAVIFGDVEMVNRLLGLGLAAHINTTDINGRTALFRAAYWNKSKIVSALLEVDGIDLSVRDVEGRTPLRVAIDRGSDGCAELLRKAGAS